MTGFRDWLRRHPEDRDRYEHAKRDQGEDPGIHSEQHQDAEAGTRADDRDAGADVAARPPAGDDA